MGCQFLPQGIFLTRGSNPLLLHLLHWQADSLPLCHPGSLSLRYRWFAVLTSATQQSDSPVSIYLILFHTLFHNGLPCETSVKVAQLSDSLQPHRLHSPWNSTGQNTGAGSYSLLQGIFPTQGLNPGLLHYQQGCVLTDTENRLVVAKGQGSEGGKYREFGTSICKLLYIGWIDNKVPLYSTGN